MTVWPTARPARRLQLLGPRVALLPVDPDEDVRVGPGVLDVRGVHDHLVRDRRRA